MEPAAVLCAVDDVAGYGAAVRAGPLAVLQRHEHAYARGVLHVVAGRVGVEIGAAVRGVDHDAAAVCGEGAGVIAHGRGVEHGVHLGRLRGGGAAGADRAGDFARRLGALLGGFVSALHGRAGAAVAGGVCVVVGAAVCHVVDLLVVTRRARLKAAALGDLQADVLGRIAAQLRAVAVIVVVKAGAARPDEFAGGRARVGPADGRGGGASNDPFEIRAGAGAGQRAGRDRRRGHRGHGGRGRDRADGGAAGRDRALTLRGGQGDDQVDEHDKPQRRGDADADAHDLVKAPPTPEQIDAQRREEHEQHVRHPVVFVDILHEGGRFAGRAFYIVAVLVIIAAVVGVAAVVGIVAVGVIAVVVITIVVIAVVVITVVVIAVVVIAVVVIAVVVIAAGIVAAVAVAVVGVARLVVSIGSVAAGIAAVAVVIIARIVAGVAVVALALRAVIVGVVVLVEAVGYVCILRRFQAERKTPDLTVAPAESDPRLGEVELQFSKFVCCHALHLVLWISTIYIVTLL